MNDYEKMHLITFMRTSVRVAKGSLPFVISSGKKTRTRKVIECPPNSIHFLGSLWPIPGSSVRRVEAKEHAGLKKTKEE